MGNFYFFYFRYSFGMVIGMIHGMLNVTVFSNTHHRPKKAFVLPFPNATHQRSVGSLHKPTENAFFNLCMKNTRPHNNGRKRPALCSRKNISLCC